MKLDPSECPDSVYRSLTSLIVPRPIGWISTTAQDGTDNLAPYSYFNAIGSQPPVVMFSAGDHQGDLKDTARNAMDTEEFVYNLVTRDLIEDMDKTSAYVNESEFKTANLEKIPSETISAPRVKKAAATLECEVIETNRIGSATVVFGEINLFHISESLVTEEDGGKKVLAEKVDAVGRVGGHYYTGIDLLEFTRQY